MPHTALKPASSLPNISSRTLRGAHRDENLDGTFTFTDMVSGEVNLSNVAAVSPNPDTEGDRDVFGAFIEFASKINVQLYTLG